VGLVLLGAGLFVNLISSLKGIMASSLGKRFFFCGCLNFPFMTSLSAQERKEPGKARKEKIELTDYDRRVLENGEISDFRRVTGSLLAVVPGFGLGHAVQGRYQYKGMIFTLTELGSIAVLYGPTGDGGLGIGLISLLGFKVWEFIDAVVGSERDNIRYRQLQSLALETGHSHFTILPVPLVKNGESGQQTTHPGLAFTWDIH
jgi:hypothetical protein